MIKKILVAGAATIAAIAAPAGAVTFEPVNYTFNFTGESTDPNPTIGNVITKTVGGITVTASAWSIDKSIGVPFASHGTASSLNLQQAKLVGYQGGGLGVTDKYESGSAPYHTTDNVGAYDFIMLSFSRPVQLLFGSLTPFSVNGAADNDAWVSFSDVAPGSTPLTDSKVFANMILHATEVQGNLSGAAGYVSYLNPGMNTGYSWIVGADAFDGRARDDGFKLAAFNVQLPVPEPATWASMILGLGMLGAFLRRRSPAPLAARA